MLTFRTGMDPHSLDVYDTIDYKEQVIGMLQWHPERQPRFVKDSRVMFTTIAQMKEIVAKWDEILIINLRESQDRTSRRKHATDNG